MSLSDGRCPYCLQPMETSGCVNWRCPPKRLRNKRVVAVGWQCPACGAVHAPWVAGCSCSSGALQNVFPEPDVAQPPPGFHL